MTDDLIEQVARAICKMRGYDPDEVITRNSGIKPRWKQHEAQAKAALAIAEPLIRKDQRMKDADWLHQEGTYIINQARLANSNGNAERASELIERADNVYNLAKQLRGQE